MLWLQSNDVLINLENIVVIVQDGRTDDWSITFWGGENIVTQEDFNNKEAQQERLKFLKDLLQVEDKHGK